MRRIFVDRAESMLKALATLLISMSGSLASSMMCVATPGGEGKFTSERRCASTSGFTRHAPNQQSGDHGPYLKVSVRAAQNLNSARAWKLQARRALARHQSRKVLNSR